METLYTGHLHAFPLPPSGASVGGNISMQTASGMSSAWGAQGGLVALAVVLGSSVSLVGLAFAFITYSLFSDLRSLAGTALLSLLASLFMGQLLFVIGVGGVQDPELCLSLSLALLFMKLAALCWLCCCCHHTLSVFQANANLIPRPETKMGRSLAHYSLVSWGFPLLMVVVSAAFKYKERDSRLAAGPQIVNVQITHGVGSKSHCWLMQGSAYTWGFLVPAVTLLLVGLWFAAQSGGAVKTTAGLQIDPRARTKLLKRRGLQVGLFVRLLVLLSMIVLLGGAASYWDTPELWAAYSIGQGVQGIVTALLVTCNCRVLKLYTAPRGHKSRRGKYRSLRDGEGGKYGVLSVTNPNYENTTCPSTAATMAATTTTTTTSAATIGVDDEEPGLAHMTYREEDLFVERCELRETLASDHAMVSQTGELSGALGPADLPRSPLPQSV